jgi:pimeloyl-ACP methyl ester carboxylesterase
VSSDTETYYSITEHWLQGEHGAMRYWASSPQHGLPLLLIHGYGSLIEHWQPVMRTLTRHHTLYALDLYGFGYSARPQRRDIRFSKELWADQVADFISQVLPEQVILVGHSVGGMVAAQVALDYAPLVRGLVMVDSVGMLDPTHHRAGFTFFDTLFLGMMRMPGIGEALSVALTTPAGVRQFLSIMYHCHECNTPEQLEIFCKPLREPGATRSYLAVLREMTGFLLDIQPGDIQVPTLLIWGAKDSTLPPELAQAFKQQMFPQAHLHFIPESGHCPFDETPGAFCDALLSWVTQVQNRLTH